MDWNKFINLMSPNVDFFGEKNNFALWIWFLLSSLPGLFKFDIPFLNILFVLIGIIP